MLDKNFHFTPFFSMHLDCVAALQTSLDSRFNQMLSRLIEAFPDCDLDEAWIHRGPCILCLSKPISDLIEKIISRRLAIEPPEARLVRVIIPQMKTSAGDHMDLAGLG